MNSTIIRAIFFRNFAAYFASPIGYVFICAFVLLTGFAAFWPNEFFSSNLANLDQLNRSLPWIMLIFIPAITMGAWADERRQGTDELLLTLPCRDIDVVMGKYLAALAIFTVALAFSLSNLLVLVWLGSPDLGVIVANYVGYWLVGAAMLSIGMIASFMTSSLTVAFILALAFNSPLVFAASADAIVPWPDLARMIAQLSIKARFEDFGRGLITLSGVVFFLAIVPAGLYLGMTLIGRRHWAGRRDAYAIAAHSTIRFASLLAIAFGVGLLATRFDARLDLSQGRINSLGPQTAAQLHAINTARPVHVEAFISPNVPEQFVQTRLNLLSVLREAQARGGGRIVVNIHDTPRHSEQETRAADLFNIRPVAVATNAGGTLGAEEIVLGAAFTCGLDKIVVPFFPPGLPVEYEVVRSIATVSQPQRRTVGVVTTEAQLFGGFDMATMSNRPGEEIVQELRKQYDVSQVSADAPIATRYDVLLVAQPSSLTPSQLENVMASIRRGQPTAIFEDPFPYFDPSVTPTAQPRQPPNNMFMQQQPPLPKGNIMALWNMLGVNFPGNEVVWQDYNPYPRIAEIPPEFVWVSPAAGGNEAFSASSPVTAGLQQVLAPFPGSVTPREGATTAFAPLLKTGPRAGYILFDNIFGPAGINPNRSFIEAGAPITLAAHITGQPADAAMDTPAGGAAAMNVMLVADIDMLYSVFFAMRAQGEDENSPLNISLDNVTFVLNVLDTLAGDDRFIEIRKRRPAYRTLTAVEREVSAARAQAADERDAFIREFETSQASEQAKFDAKIQQLQQREGIDAQQMLIEVATAQQAGQNRLAAMTQRLEKERDARIDAIERELALRVRGIQNRYKLLAVALPPVLPLVLAIGVFTYRKKLERIGVPGARLR